MMRIMRRGEPLRAIRWPPPVALSTAPWGRTSLELVGAALLLLALWQLATVLAGTDLPGPARTLPVLWELIRDPLYDRGPNDKGIALQLLSSLQRVFLGFALGSLIAIPLGVVMGASRLGRGLLNPLVQVFRPVSPLAWFPIGLAALHSAPTATVFVICITSLWPTVINTAFGIASLPEDHKNVARVFQFSRWKYFSKILWPYSLPHILTGLRLSLGVAWMVIVAAEMLAGGVGIGFFVWDSWNTLHVERVIAALLLIGAVGLAMDRVLELLARRASYAT
jgi:nitrate/nitrite transport system permease protein